MLTAVDVIYEQRERVFHRDIQGRFPFEQKTQFAVPEYPMAKWNATVGRFPFDGNSGNLA